MEAIMQIEQHAAKIRNGEAKVYPGQPHRISEAASINDGYAQGDLNIIIIDKIPDDYVKIEPKALDKQLVPGNTEGSKHCLDSLDGVIMYHHKEWNHQSYDGLFGPALTCSKERVIEHPKHGNITIPAGFTILTTYQPNYDYELKKEIRSKD